MNAAERDPGAPPVTLALAGDVMLGRLVDQAIARKGFAYPWGDLLPVLHRVQLFCINLECALTAVTERWTDGSYKPFYFRADPAAVETLVQGRVAFAALANNHIGDFGAAGLMETVRVLDAAGIAHAGAGANLAAARAPAVIAAGGVRVAIVAFADHPAAWAATASQPGLNYTPISLAEHDLAPVATAVAAARELAPMVICSLHWGPNMRLRPDPGFRTFAHRLVESGVDIVWGHSAHVVQGVEVYQDRLILYDTGDLVDDYAVDRRLRNDLSGLFLVHLAPPRIRELTVIPVQIARCQVRLAEGPAEELFVERFGRLCGELGTRVERRPEGVIVRLG